MSEKRSVMWVWSALFVFIVSVNLWGATYTVDPSGGEDYTTIQAAIDAPTTTDGDIIEVVPGTYLVDVHGDPNLNSIRIDKAITLKSETGVRNSVILDGNDFDTSDPNYYGSVIVVTSGGQECVIRDLTIQSGYADEGGGICGLKEKTDNYYPYNPFFEVKNCIIKNNYASITGGGIWGCVGTIEDCLIQNNVCGFYDSVEGYTYGEGGGISYAGVDSYLNSNTGEECFCGFPDSCLHSFVTIKDCEISGNFTGVSGGGLYVKNCYTDNFKMTVTDCNIIENEIIDYNGHSGYGAGVSGDSCDFKEHPVVVNCTIEGNKIEGSSGRGAGCYNVNVKDCLIKDNINNDYDDGNWKNIGGGIYNCTAYACTIQDNIAEIGGGGDRSWLYDCDVINCNAIYIGGGLASEEGDCSSYAERCYFSGNTAMYGGAIGGGGATVKNCLIVDNLATESGGGYFVEQYGNILNSTISGNEAFMGSGICSRSDYNSTIVTGVYARNCIVYGNTLSSDGSLSDIDAEFDEVKYSCFSEAGSSPSGNENISSGPNFIDPGNGDYHLDSGSNCIDTGDPNVVASGGEAYYVGTQDIDGQIRIQDYNEDDGIEIIDMGAYEKEGDGLVLHLTFDDVLNGCVAPDSSDNDYDGSIDGADEIDGYDGQALDFDGVDDYVEINNAWIGREKGPTWKGIHGSASRTCAAWIKTSETNAGEIISWGTDAAGEKWLVTVINGVVAVYIHTGNVTGTTVVNDGNWHHVVALYDGNNVTLYVDGKQDGAGSLAVNTGDSFNVKIGTWSGIFAGHFSGLIDDVRIYSRALSTEEIYTLAGAPVAVVSLPLDQDAYDVSGNGYDGTENGNPSYLDNAISLDGIDDYVEITGWKGITGGHSRTCSAWIKTSDYHAGQVISWGTDSPGQKWQVCVGNGVLRAYVYSGNVQGTTRIDDGNWHHIAAVLEDDGSPSADEIEIYVDGVKEVLSSSTAYTVNTGNYYDVKIGRWEGIYGTYFTGQIDDVRIYSRALGSDEIGVLAGQ